MPAAFLLAAVLAAAVSAVPPAPAPEALHAAWPGVRLSPPSGSYAPEALRADLEALAGYSRGVVRMAEKGRSSEGREIPVLLAGSGPEKVLLWSQMHGDEPTATAALVDLLAFLAENRAEPATAYLLSRLTLVVVPMLNPDGAVRGDRRNAQGIDINRDAVRLQSPEGRFLKEIRDRYTPVAGFNLHNQSPLVTAGPGGAQVTIAVLAVSAAEAEPEGPALERKRGLAGHLARVASTFVPGRVTRYATDYTERAFGDSMSRWGTPTVLLETGGWHGPREEERLVRLNFVLLLSALHALARGEETADAPFYETLPPNVRGDLVDLLLRGATVHGGRGLPPFLSDVAVVKARAFAGDGRRLPSAALVDVGDLAHLAGLEEVDAAGLVVAPAPAGGAEAWDKAVSSLAARGLAKDGALLLDEDALAREARAWAAGRAIVPWAGIDLVLFRKAETGLVVEGFVRGGSRTK
jgi:hypothetical protein